MKALLIPADPSRSVELIEINGRDDLRQHVGGISEATQYDYDAIMYVSDTGRIDGQPMNLRATEYIRAESEAAKQGRMIGIDPSYGLYGNVVVVGNAEQGLRDVPNRLVERFGPTRDVSLGDRIRDVLQDRNEDGMIRIPWRKDPATGGRFLDFPIAPNTQMHIAKLPGERVRFDFSNRREDRAFDQAMQAQEAELRERGIEDVSEYRQGWSDGYVAGVQTPATYGSEHPEPTDYHLGHREGYAEGQADLSRGEQPEWAKSEQQPDWLRTFEQEIQEREHQRDQDKGQGY